MNVLNSYKKAILALSLALLLTVSIFGTLALLSTDAEPVVNTFTPTKVPNEVVETIEGNVKKEVQIKNTGNIDAYIRAAVVINWVDKNGNVYAHAPAADTDYAINWTMTDWVKKDGFYYYTKPVAPGATTKTLFTDCKVIGTPPTGYQLSVEIMAQSIQAEGVGGENGLTPAVTLAWGMGVNADGTLNVQ